MSQQDDWSRLNLRQTRRQQQEEEKGPSLWDRIGRLPGALATGVRIGTGVLASEGGWTGAFKSAAGEALAQNIENLPRLREIPGAIRDIASNVREGYGRETAEGFAKGAGVAASRIGTEAAIGAVPGSAYTRAGKFLESGARSGAMAGVGSIGRDVASGETPDLEKAAWVAGLGALTGGTIGAIQGVPSSRAMPEADRLAKANEARQAAGQAPRNPNQPNPNIHRPIPSKGPEYEKRQVNLALQGLRSKWAKEAAEDKAAEKAAKEAREYAENEARLDRIAEERMNAGATEAKVSFGDTLSAKDPSTGKTVRQSTRYSKPDEEKTKAVKLPGVTDDVLEASRPQAPVENVPAPSVVAPEGIPQAPPTPPVTPTPTQPNGRISTTEISELRHQELLNKLGGRPNGVTPPTAVILPEVPQAPTQVAPVPAEIPASPSVLARFFKTPADAAGTHYKEVKAAAPQEPKLTEPLQVTDSKGKPYTAKRIAGKNARQAAAAEGIPPLPRKAEDVALTPEDLQVPRITPPMEGADPTVGTWTDDLAAEVERLTKLKQETGLAGEDLIGKAADVESVEAIKRSLEQTPQAVAPPPAPVAAPVQAAPTAAAPKAPKPKLVKTKKAPGVSDETLEAPQLPMEAPVEQGFKLGGNEIRNLLEKGFTREQIVALAQDPKGVEQLKRALTSPYIGNEGKGEKGFITPELFKFLAKASVPVVGAGVGAAMNPDDPLTGAAVGGGLGMGAFAPELARAMSRVDLSSVTPENARETAIKIVKELPHIQRFNHLASVHGMVANAAVGPYMSGLLGSIERGLKGDPRGWQSARALLVGEDIIDEARQAYTQAGQRVETAERRTLGAAPNAFQKFLSYPGHILTTGDMTIRNILQKHGFTDAESRIMTLSNEPGSIPGRQNMFDEFGKGVVNFQRSTGPIGNMMLPFARTPMNILRQGADRFPVLGALYGLFQGKGLRDVAAEQAVSIPVAGASYIAGQSMDPETARTARRYVSNAGGQNSLASNIFFMLGQEANRNNPNTGNALSQGVQGALTAPDPGAIGDKFRFIGDFLSGRFGEKVQEEGIANSLPRGAIPAYIREATRRPAESDLLGPEIPDDWSTFNPRRGR